MTQTVEILDGIMGSCKTTNICKWMEEHNTQYKFFYISPLLDEVKDGGRIQQSCPTTRFVAPENIETDKQREESQRKGIKYKRKSDHLLHLLQVGANITCTHNLYLSMTEDHFNEMKKHNYVLIIDEELGMIDDYKTYTSPDVKSLVKLGCLEIQDKDGMLVWKKDDVTEFNDIGHQYYNFKRHVDNNMIYVSKRDSNIFVCQLPTKLITIAERCIILTYMFGGNILSSFLKLKGLDYVPFTEVTIKDVNKESIKQLITLHKPKMKKWDKDMKLSVSAYNGMSSENIKFLSNYICSIAKDCSATDYDVMYTFPKDRCNLSSNKRTNKIKPKGFVDTTLKHPDKVCWIYASCRATNKHRHKSVVIHAYDRYPNQSVASYLQDFNTPVDAKVFALSEMLQWVWRSRIRDGKQITLAILSKRMKLLFLNWLFDLPLDNNNYAPFSEFMNK